MKKTLCITITLFAFLTFPFLPNSLAQTHRPQVRLVYFIPSDRTSKNDIKVKMRRIIRDVQKFFADEMERHGYGRKTFQIETNATGQIMVHQVKGKFNSLFYLRGGDVLEEFSEQFPGMKNIIFALIETGDEDTQYGGCGVGGIWPWPPLPKPFSSVEEAYTGNPRFRGIAWVNTVCFNFGTVGHELGHAFGLDHDWRDNDYIMSYGRDRSKISKCAAEWLDVHRAFNPAQPVINTALTAEMHPPRFVSLPNIIHLGFTLTDPDGIHQVQLLGSTNLGFGSPGLIACKGLDGESSRTVEFMVNASVKTARIELRVIDVHGNFDRSVHRINIKTLLPSLVHIGAAQRPPMYWIDTNNGRLYRLISEKIERLLPSVENATSLTLDMPNRKLYWTEKHSDRSGKIRRANLNGSNVEDIKDLTSVPLDITLDITHSKLYLTNSWGKVQRLNLDGSNFQPNLITGLQKPNHLILVNNKVYWTEQTDDQSGKIRRANLNGSNVEDIKDFTSVPHGLAVDRIHSKLYLTNSRGKVQRLNLDGSNFQPNLITQLDAPMEIAVDVTASKIYWIERNRIRRANLNGGNIQDVLRNFGTLTSITLGDTPTSNATLAAPTAMRTPQQTLLLANYPNPFNPETWIPYQLSKPADVTLTIYAVNGQLVRQLALGHQAAGIYISPSRSAYWNGKNEVGEPIASGVYFYTPSAGDFMATRKMLIMK